TPGGKVGGEVKSKEANGKEANIKMEPPPAVQPLPKVEAKPDKKPRPKMPVPDVVKQADAERVIKETYAPDYAGKKKAAELTTGATKFLKEGNETDDNPAVQFVLFREAGDFAARGGDLDLVVRCLDELGSRFAVNTLEMKIDSLTRAAQAATSQPA